MLLVLTTLPGVLLATATLQLYCTAKKKTSKEEAKSQKVTTKKTTTAGKLSVASKIAQLKSNKTSVKKSPMKSVNKDDAGETKPEQGVATTGLTERTQTEAEPKPTEPPVEQEKEDDENPEEVKKEAKEEPKEPAKRVLEIKKPEPPTQPAPPAVIPPAPIPEKKVTKPGFVNNPVVTPVTDEYPTDDEEEKKKKEEEAAKQEKKINMTQADVEKTKA